MQKCKFSFWTVLIVFTLFEIVRAITEYEDYGRGLGFGLTVIVPLLILLPLAIGYQISRIISLHRCGDKRIREYVVSILLLSVFTVALICVVIDIVCRYM